MINDLRKFLIAVKSDPPPSLSSKSRKLFLRRVHVYGQLVEAAVDSMFVSLCHPLQRRTYITGGMFGENARSEDVLRVGRHADGMHL